MKTGINDLDRKPILRCTPAPDPTLERLVPGQCAPQNRTEVQRRTDKRGYTLVEVVLAIAIMALFFNGVIMAYIQAGTQAEWSGYSLAAQSLSMQQLEQARAAVWDYSISKNEITNLNLAGWTYNTNTGSGRGYSTTVLDLPISGTNTITATNYVTLKLVNYNNATNPPVQMQMLTVDTVWPCTRYGKARYYTNRTATYFGPDARDPSTL